MLARSEVIGVRSSWLASAMRWRWAATERSSASRVPLKLAARRPSSSRPPTSRRRERSRLPDRVSVCSVKRPIGASAVRATSVPRIAASMIPAPPISDQDQQQPAELVVDLGQGTGDQDGAARARGDGQDPQLSSFDRPVGEARAAAPGRDRPVGRVDRDARRRCLPAWDVDAPAHREELHVSTRPRRRAPAGPGPGTASRRRSPGRRAPVGPRAVGGAAGRSHRRAARREDARPGSQLAVNFAAQIRAHRDIEADRGGQHRQRHRQARDRHDPPPQRHRPAGPLMALAASSRRPAPCGSGCAHRHPRACAAGSRCRRAGRWRSGRSHSPRRGRRSGCEREPGGG